MADTDIDARDWLPAENGDSRASNTAAYRDLDFSVDMSEFGKAPAGDYDIYLKVNDPKETSFNKRCIQFANHGTWNATLGANLIGSTSVVERPLQSISLDKSALALKKGETAALAVSYNPTDTTDGKAVAWESGDSAVATVSGGVVTAKKSGSATITATVGDKAAICTVTVTNPAAALGPGPASVAIAPGGVYTIKAVVTPADADGSTTFESSDATVATVDATGKVTVVKKALAKAKGLKFTKSKLSWKKVAHNNGYTLKIMQGKKTVKTVNVKKGKTSYAVPKKLLKKGKYYHFTLVAKGAGNYKNSAPAKSKRIKIK
jgi:uncharacterized protein YjdB